LSKILIKQKKYSLAVDMAVRALNLDGENSEECEEVIQLLLEQDQRKPAEELRLHLEGVN